MESFWARMQVELLNRKRWNTRRHADNVVVVGAAMSVHCGPSAVGGKPPQAVLSVACMSGGSELDADAVIDPLEIRSWSSGDGRPPSRSRDAGSG
jgi:hypothetical protein